MTVSEGYPTDSPWRVGPIYLPNLGIRFSRTKSFCFENDVLLTFGLGMREGVSEGSRHGNGVGHFLIHDM